MAPVTNWNEEYTHFGHILDLRYSLEASPGFDGGLPERLSDLFLPSLEQGTGRFTKPHRGGSGPVLEI